MKKIVLIDYYLGFLPLIAELDNVEIVLLIVESDKQKEKVLSSYPNINVHVSNEIVQWDKTFVTQEDIIKYKSTQLKVEKFIQRFTNDYSLISLYYYSALAFWLNVFSSPVDCLFVGKVIHGSHDDAVPVDIAKSLSIPTFTMEVVLHNGIVGLHAVKCENTGKYLNVSKIGNKKVDLLCVKQVILRIIDDKDEENLIDAKVKAINNSLLRNILVICMNLSVSIAKLKSIFTNKNVNRGNIKKRLYSKFGKIYVYLSSFLISPNRNPEWSVINGIQYNLKRSELFKSLRYLKKIRRYYRKHSVKTIPDNQKYVLYSLHFEPEASIMNRTVYNNQLYNVEMLSSCLPEGWVLYVKEHPDQFKIDSPSGIMTMRNISQYRNKNFYNKLLSMHNVYLLDDRISSWDLLSLTKNGASNNRKKGVGILKAVSTINGSISVECMAAGKPVILFSSSSVPYGEIPDIFNVNSKEDILEIFRKLSDDLYVPDYGTYMNVLSEMLIKCDYNGFDISAEFLSELFDKSEEILRC